MRYKTDFKYIRPGPLFLGNIMVIKLLLLSTHMLLYNTVYAQVTIIKHLLTYLLTHHRQLFCQI